MLTAQNLAAIYPAGTPDLQMTGKTGAAVSVEIGGRYLCRYVRGNQLAQAVSAIATAIYLTPTAYAPGEVGKWLALPMPHMQRDYVVFIDPQKVTGPILGPRRVLAGGGIEYVLPQGYPQSAVVPIGLPNGRWPILVT